jgi:hypothetical protein
MWAVASSAGPVRFRPMPLPELLDELFRVYRRHFSLIVGVALIVALPGLVWSLVTGTYKVTTSSYSQLFPIPGTNAPATPNLNSQETSNLLIALGLGGLGGLILLPISVGAVFRAATDVLLGRPATIASVLRETLARYLPLFGLILLSVVIAVGWFIAFFIGLVLLVLPGLAVVGFGIYLGVRWSLSVAALMAEDIGPVKAMSRSWNLVSGQWWRTFGVLLVVAIMQFIIGLALGFLFGIIAGVATSGDLQLAVASVGSALLSAVISPIVTIAVTLLYFDLRVRKEGLDLDQLAQQTTPGPAPA